MSNAWAIVVRRENAAALVEVPDSSAAVAEDGDLVWVRGTGSNAELSAALSRVAAVGRYELLQDGQLIVAGGRVPSERLPKLKWHSLQEWLRPRQPAAAFPGQLQSKATLRLVRSSVGPAANAVLTDATQWLAFAEEAPAVRLRPLVFAMDALSRVLVRGKPLPDVEGRRFVEAEGVLVPTGFRLQPELPAAMTRRLCNAAEGDVVLFHEEAEFEVLPQSAFVQATRSSARLSCAEAKA